LATPEFDFLARADRTASGKRVEHDGARPEKPEPINLIHEKSLIPLNCIVMNKFILLLATIFGLGVVAQAADPTPAASPAASAPASPKHHGHHKKATSSPASPKASASPKA
jgi:hypothetical protein